MTGSSLTNGLKSDPTLKRNRPLISKNCQKVSRSRNDTRLRDFLKRRFGSIPLFCNDQLLRALIITATDLGGTQCKIINSKFIKDSGKKTDPILFLGGIRQLEHSWHCRSPRHALSGSVLRELPAEYPHCADRLRSRLGGSSNCARHKSTSRLNSQVALTQIELFSNRLLEKP